MNAYTALQVDEAEEALFRQLDHGIFIFQDAFFKHDQVLSSVTSKATKDSQNQLWNGVMLATLDSSNRNRDTFYNFIGRLQLCVQQYRDAVRAHPSGNSPATNRQHHHQELLLQADQYTVTYHEICRLYPKSLDDRAACDAMFDHMKSMRGYL